MLAAAHRGVKEKAGVAAVQHCSPVARLGSAVTKKIAASFCSVLKVLTIDFSPFCLLINLILID